MTLSQEQVQEGQDLFQKIINEAWGSSAFKEQLIANPVSAIKQICDKGFSMPEGKQIVVEDQTDSSVIYLNIPAEPNMDDLQLNDEQLQLISGGITPTFVIAGIVIVTVAAGYGIASGINYLVNGSGEE